MPSRSQAAPVAGSPAPNPDESRSHAIVLGAAGHVDHGKSTLVHALTGIDPDRLAEEKAREMTIDLGFAWLTLPDGRVASIVDVPGHERFIKNMLAGAGGIDAALLVIAADEGPMPQTREHLAILDLLGIQHGLVVLTKTDLIDRDWLDLVSIEIAELVAGTGLDGAPIVPVSARTGAGLDILRQELAVLATRVPRRTGSDRPRLAIDRVFTMAGFGTVVTGTLDGGWLHTGQELRLYPAGPLVRVRGLQSQRTVMERAGPGSRIAANLTGVAVDQVRRGDVLAPDGVLHPTIRLDARIRLLAGGSWRLEQNAAVDLFVGAAERPARVTLLDRVALAPGDTGWVQLRLAAPVAVLPGERFILRRPSPGETIGGGEIVDVAPPKHRRFRPEVLASLEALITGDPAAILHSALSRQPATVASLRATPPGTLTPNQVDTVLAKLLDAGVVKLAQGLEGTSSDALVMTAEAWLALTDKIQRLVSTYHVAHPLRRGQPREALKAGLGLSPALFDAVLARTADDGIVIDEQTIVRLPAFRIALSPEQAEVADRFLAALTAFPYAPPAPATFGLDPELLAALDHLGRVVRVSPEIAFTPAAFATLRDGTLAAIDAEGSISLAQFRDRFGTSRKYAQAVLEHLDRQRLTRRIGDDRVRWSAAFGDRGSH